MINRETFIKNIKPYNQGYKANKEWVIGLLDVNQNYAIRLYKGVYSAYAVVSKGTGTTIEYFIGKRFKLSDSKNVVYNHYQENFEKYKL